MKKLEKSKKSRTTAVSVDRLGDVRGGFTQLVLSAASTTKADKVDMPVGSDYIT